MAAGASYVRGSSQAQAPNALTTREAAPYSQAVILGVRGAYQGSYGSLSVQPYAGVDIQRIAVDDYHLGGAFEQKDNVATVWSVPVGVKFGWAVPVPTGTLNTFFDLRADPSFGDTKTSVKTWACPRGSRRGLVGRYRYVFGDGPAWGRLREQGGLV